MKVIDALKCPAMPPGDYVLALCEDSTGHRSIAVVSCLDREDALEKINSVCFFTDEIPPDLLNPVDVFKIAELVGLGDRGRFYVNSHGIWLTSEEFDDFLADRPIRWLNGRIPVLPDR